MKKRLRKKKRLGEFAEYGFMYELLLRAPLTEDQHWDFIDQMCDELHKIGLCASAGFSVGHVRCGGYASGTQGHPRGKVTPKTQVDLLLWLLAHPLVEAAIVDDLQDCWHGYDEAKTDAFHARANVQLGPDKPHHCPGGYLYWTLDTPSEFPRRCSICRKALTAAEYAALEAEYRAYWEAHGKPIQAPETLVSGVAL